MINKYAEINDRILLYNACKGILRVKQAADKGYWLEDNVLRPMYDGLYGTGSYNNSKFTSFDFSPVKTDYAKTNPNISSELAARANSYRNFTVPRGYAHKHINAVPTGSMKYMSPEYRQYITENVSGSVIPSTNKGNGLVPRYDNFFGSIIRNTARKPRRLQPRKRSIEDHYNDLKSNWSLSKMYADKDIELIRQNNPFATKYNTGIEAANAKKEKADKRIAALDDELNKKKQMYAQKKQQNAQKQRELARLKKNNNK